MKLWNYLGQLIGEGCTNSSGDWTKTGISYTYYYSDLDRDLNGLSNSWVNIQQGESKTDQTPLFLPPGITRYWVTDETNVYHHVNVIHDYFAGNPFNYTGMNYQSLAYVHQGSGEAASSNGTNIYFGSYEGQYWARAADVVYHEYTHSTIYHLYGEWIGWGNQGGAMDEGFADYFSAAKTSDEILGESVADFPGSGLPRDLGNSLTMDNYVQGDDHFNGQIIAGACWDLRQALSTTDDLVFGALQRTPHAYNFSAMADNVVYEDDNDGNPNNGTPNLETIRSKFHGKKIYFAAGPPQAPQNVTISGTVDQHPTISWSANNEPDLSGYKVYRKIPPFVTEFVLIATVNSATTSYTDNDIYLRSGSGDPQAHYYVKAYDASNYHSVASITVVAYVHPPGWPKASPDLPELPMVSQLFEAYPNPFNPSTEIRFALAEPARVSLVVYDALGREAASLADGHYEAGFHSAVWNASGRSSGVYFARIVVTNAAGQIALSKIYKLVLAK